MPVRTIVSFPAPSTNRTGSAASAASARPAGRAGSRRSSRSGSRRRRPARAPARRSTDRAGARARRRTPAGARSGTRAGRRSTAPGTIPTATKATSSARRPPRRASRPASDERATMTPTSAIVPQRTARSPNSWAEGSKSKVDDGDRHGGDECIEGRRRDTMPSSARRRSSDLSARRHIRCQSGLARRRRDDIIGAKSQVDRRGRSIWAMRRTSLGAPAAHRSSGPRGHGPDVASQVEGTTMATSHPAPVSVLTSISSAASTPGPTDGRHIRLPGRHAQALFALLVLARRPRSREAIAADLWPDADADRPVRCARPSGSSARASPRPGSHRTGLLDIDADTVGIRIDARIDLDVTRFEACLADDACGAEAAIDALPRRPARGPRPRLLRGRARTPGRPLRGRPGDRRRAAARGAAT